LSLSLYKKLVHQNNHHNQIIIIMKKLITFGIALVALGQVNAATVKSTNEQGESFQSDSLVTEQKHLAPVEDQAVLNPSVVFSLTSQRSMEDVIAEDRRITENSLTVDGELLYIEKSAEEIIATDKKVTEAPNAEIRPLYLERTIEDKIAEDNAIIENTAIEVQPLDFDSINKKQLILKKDNSLLVGMN
jgi:hypothetical protein